MPTKEDDIKALEEKIRLFNAIESSLPNKRTHPKFTALREEIERADSSLSQEEKIQCLQGIQDKKIKEFLVTAHAFIHKNIF